MCLMSFETAVYLGDTVLHRQAPGYGVYGVIVGSTTDGYVLQPCSNRSDAELIRRQWIAPFAEVETLAQVRARELAERLSRES